MKAAIIGLPRSGKSTTFSAVTGVEVDPYAPREVRQAIARVPDPRLAYLTDLYHPKKVTEATIEFLDVPGCSLDDSKEVQEWRRLLPAVRQADLLVVVLRDFVNDSIPPYRDRIDPQDDFSMVWDEFLFADLDTVTTRVERLEQALKKPTKTHDIEQRELTLLTKCREALESETPLSAVIHSDDERKQLSSFAFLTEKPVVTIRNVSDDQVLKAQELQFDHVTASLVLGASIEAEIGLLDADDRAAFLDDLGLQTPARERVIRTCYTACGLISFLTMGSDEVRAWTIPKGATAVEAAAKVHTDLAQGFIRAETVAYADLFAHKDMKGARAVGKVRKEGKSYVVEDGDILNILSSS